MNSIDKAETLADNPSGNQHRKKTFGGFLRNTGAVSLIAALASAAALTGAAFATVTQANCEVPGRYVQHNGKLEFVGGCITSNDLITKDPSQRQTGPLTDAAQHHTSP